MIMNETLHLKNDVGRLYMSRKGGERGLASIQEKVHASIRRLEDYVKSAGKER